MTLHEIILEKLTDYAEKYGLEAGFDLLKIEIEAELSVIFVEYLLQKYQEIG